MSAGGPFDEWLRVGPRRPPGGRVIAGVCAGLAALLRLDVTLVRLAFVFLMLAWGIGGVLYVLLWLFMPEEGAAPARAWSDIAQRNWTRARGQIAGSARRVSRVWRSDVTRSSAGAARKRAAGIALLALGALIGLVSLGAFDWITPALALGLGVVAAGTALLIATWRS